MTARATTTIRTPRGTFKAVTFPTEEAARAAGFSLYFNSDDGTDIFTKTDCETYRTDFAIVKNPEILYLSSHEYNTELVLQKLAEMIISQGGKMQHGLVNCVMQNRTLIDQHHEFKEHIDKAESLGKTEYAAELKKKLNELPEVETVNRFYSTWCGHSLRFLLDGDYYHLQMDENPFFNPYLIKQHVINKYGVLYVDKKCYAVKLDPVMHDDIFKPRYSKDQIKEQAEYILTVLKVAKYSEKYGGTLERLADELQPNDNGQEAQQ